MVAGRVRRAIWRRRAARARYEHDVDRALRRLVRPGAVCVDGGAHRGVFTVLMARLTGRGGHVYAFEPQPENAAFVRRAVARRGLAGRVTVEVAALLAESGPVELFPARTGGSSEWTVDRNFAAREDTAPVDRRPITVAAVALDDYLPDGQRVDVVKLDVEGAEGQAISGMLETLGTHSPVLVVEFHHYDWSAVELLLDAGYGLFDLDGSPVRRLRELDDVPYHFLARK